MSSTPAPLVAHILYRLDVGGLENGLVNLINNMPPEKYRHAIICLTSHGSFARRLRRDDVQLFSLDKKPGKDLHMYVRLWRLLRSLRPQVVHTRNLPALDSQWIAAFAGVRARVHGEHGFDVHDDGGKNAKYLRVRRICRLVVDRYVPMSLHLATWLTELVRVPAGKIRQIYSGVDKERFRPRVASDVSPLPQGFAPAGAVVIGAVGRLETIKDQLTLARAFVKLVADTPNGRDFLRLVIVGDGSLREPIEKALVEGGVRELAWLPGGRDDIPDLMRSYDIFVLPSLSEGISNTILEAMATGLPIVATRVGGNIELVASDDLGRLCPAADPAALAGAIAYYVRSPEERVRAGHAGRALVEQRFSLQSMVSAYTSVYEELLYGNR